MRLWLPWFTKDGDLANNNLGVPSSARFFLQRSEWNAKSNLVMQQETFSSKSVAGQKGVLSSRSRLATSSEADRYTPMFSAYSHQGSKYKVDARPR